jgi:type II secretory pathway pseudopilin PulG
MGFTIVEVMAALVVVAIVLPTLIQGTLLCMDLAVHARMQAQAASLAQAKLSELAATRMIDQAMQTGDFGERWPQYEWMATVQSWDDPRLVELDVSVLWNRRGKDYGVTVSTLIYDGATGE